MRVNVSINSSCTPPPGYCGAFAHLISPKGLALAILCSPGVWHLPILGPALIFWHAGGFLSRSIPILYPESPGFLVSGGMTVGKWKFALPENLGIWSYCACLSSKWKWKWQFSRKPKVDSFSNNCTHDFFNDNWYSLVSSETERWFECLWALWFKFCFVCMIFVQFSLCGDSKCLYSGWDAQGAKKVFLLAHLLIFTSPNGISTSPPNFLMSRIDFTVLL